MLETIFFPFAMMISFPGAALLPGLLFSVIYFVRRKRMSGLRRKGILTIAILWLIYGAYETRMYYWMLDVVAPIRVDLLLIAPFMYFITAIGIILVLVKGKSTTGP